MRTVPVLGLILLLAVPAAAEGLFELYGGWAFTQDDNRSSAKLNNGSLNPNAQFEDGAILGLRVGTWSESVPYLGGALDFSILDPDGEGRYDSVDLDLYPLSALLMARLPLLENSTHPRGRLQPYIAAGPSLVTSRVKVPLLTGSAFRDTSVDIGLDTRAGLGFYFIEGVGAFLEYRFTMSNPSYEDRAQGSQLKLSPELRTHILQAGLSLRF